MSSGILAKHHGRSGENKMKGFENFWENKKVFITGHTGFKGSWLVEWLNILGANVYGISKNIPTLPSHFKILKNMKFYQWVIVTHRGYWLMEKILYPQNMVLMVEMK